MYKRKKKASTKARMSHTKRKVKRVVKQVAKRRKVMAKKKSTSSFDDDEPEDMDVDSSESEAEPEGEPQPEVTTTEATDEGVYKTGQACVIKGQNYPEGADVALTPEELETVQAAGVKIYPAA